MAKKLSSVEQTWSPPVLNDLFVSGGLLKSSVRTTGRNYIEYYGKETAAKIICEEIKFRTFDFYKTDNAITSLTRITWNHLHESGSTKRLNEKQIANIIAGFCAAHEIFWDDVNIPRSVVEMETYRKSFLGSACWDFGCFLSQNVSKKAATTRAPRVASAAGGTRSGVPVSGYKTSGPKSGLIKGLIGEPGEKIKFPSSEHLYVIVCESSKPKTQYVYIDPLAYPADVNKVKLGDPSGYSACKLFFNSIEAANDAIERINVYGIKVPDHITGFVLKKQSADPNGFFNVKTEIGAAYIKASKLNEAISEALAEEEVEDAVKEARKARFPEIADIDVYSEALQRE
jgi:hypothetical protein